MSIARRSAAVVFTAGLALGTLQPAPPQRPVATAAGYSILTGDFHVHAAPGDGALTPRDLRQLARRQGLDVIAVTNHNQVLAGHLIRRLPDPDSFPLVLIGSEVTNPAFHLAAVGITAAVDWNQPAAAVIDAVHAQGGIAIAAHPSQSYWKGWPDEALARVDGVEVAHPDRRRPAEASEIDEFFARAQRHNPDVAAIGSTDYHLHDAPGRCRTYLFVEERSRAGVLDAIRRGRTVAEAADGRLIGDPELVKHVEVHRRSAPAPDRGWSGMISVAAAWIGIVGLLLLPGQRR